MNSSWRSIALLVIGIGAALVFADVVMGKIYSSPAKRQVRNSLTDLQKPPEVLMISSSHGRSFHIVGQTLHEKTNGQVNLVAVPLEAGKVDAMEWVLHNRVKPLISDRNGKVLPPLSHVMFGITWWDTCPADDPIEKANNIVTHGWTYSHYLSDVAANGANDLNRNFVRNFWRHSLTRSALVRTRFAISENYNRFTNFLRALLLGKFPDDEYQAVLARWHDDIDNGHKCFLAPVHMEAMDRFVEWTKENQLDLTLVLFPLKPATITEVGLKDTIIPFSEAINAYGKEHDVRVVDLTRGVIKDENFMLDFDHLTPAGNKTLTEHTLANDLNFLLKLSPGGAVK